MELAFGDYIQLKNRFSQIEGNFVESSKGVIKLITANGVLTQWYTSSEDNIVQNLEKRLEKKQMELLANTALIRNMHWQGHSLGSDPEFFVVDGKTQAVIPAFDFLPSSKDSHGQPFWDGFQTEFNINAGSCLDARVGSMQTLIQRLDQLAKQHNPRAEISIDSTVEIDKEVFDKTSPEHLQFGCSPSLNAYGIKGLELNGSETRIRNAGGHIHFGLTEPQKKDVKAYVKSLDKILGVACVALFQNFDNPLRRQYYGLAGEYRTPSHGLEYRTLTNAWACHPRMMYIIFELARKAIAMVQIGKDKLWDASEEEVIECINNCDVNMAKQLLLINEDLFKSILHSMCYNNEKTVNIVFNTFMQGMEVLIPYPERIMKNWTGSVYNARISNLGSEKHPTLDKVIKY